jgi:rhodanese-related sulfurtransferase
VSADELEQRLQSDSVPFLLDVREPEELADGLISGSVNIPMGEVESRLNEIPAEREVVVICHVGARSAHVTRRLNALGYLRAINLSGGMNAWLSLTRRRREPGADRRARSSPS